MIVLRATDVRFVRDGADLVTPFSFALEAGGTHAIEQPTPHAASVAARLCAAIVRPTTGSVVASDFDSRLQAPEVKRRIGFVDRAGFAGDAHAFRCEVAFHADVWGIEAARAHERARTVREALEALNSGASAYAHAIALALVADVSAIVLDLPRAAFVAGVRALGPAIAIVYTRAATTDELPS